MRRALLAVTALLVLAPAAHAQQQEGSGTEIGGSVSSTLSLALAQSGAAVRAVVTTTEPGTQLSVASPDGRHDLTAEAAAGPYAPVDPAFGLTLVTWDDVLAGKATTLRLKSASAAIVLITLSAATP